MLNVIFYSPAKTKTEETSYVTDDGSIVTTVKTIKYHEPRGFACQTMTDASYLLFKDDYMENFQGDFPSAQNTESMLEGSQIVTFYGYVDDSGDENVTVPADFNSVTAADRMFADCIHLEQLNISMKSLTHVKDMLLNCVSLTQFTGDLSSLIDGSKLFTSCSELSKFEADLSSLKIGNKMFKYTSLVSFDNNLDSLVDGTEMFMNTAYLTSYTGSLEQLQLGNSMFENSTNLVSLPSTVTLSKLRSGKRMFMGTQLNDVSSFDLKKLEDGSEMFRGLSGISSWSKDMPSLKAANNMFYDCSNMSSFSGNLSNLEEMNYMFYLTGRQIVGPGRRAGIYLFNPTSLEKVKTAKYAFYQAGFINWSWDMPNLQDGTNMFDNNTALTSFTSSLEKLKDGTSMFNEDRSLTTFVSNLASLEKADNMFNTCKLTPQSVMYIVETIKDHGSGNKGITLGINCENTAQAKESFAIEAGYNSWQSMHDTLVSKGWTPTWQYNFQ